MATDDGLIYIDDMYEFDTVDGTLDEIVQVGPNAPIGMLYGSAAQIDDEQFVLFSGEGQLALTSVQLNCLFECLYCILITYCFWL